MWVIPFNSTCTPDTPLKPSNLSEMSSSIHSSVEARKHSPAHAFHFHFCIRIHHWGFLSFCWSNSHIIWIRTIFWRTIIFWDTSIYVAWRIRENICIKFTEKNLHSFLKFFVVMLYFWKFYSNKLVFIIFMVGTKT